MPPRDQSTAATPLVSQPASSPRSAKPRLSLRRPPTARGTTAPLGAGGEGLEHTVSAAVDRWVDGGAVNRGVVDRGAIDGGDEVVAGVRLMDLPRRALSDYDW